jgi:hypothetical protein
MMPDLWPLVLFGLARLEVRETYRHNMISRWLRGRFCEPVTVVVPSVKGTGGNEP